MMLPLPVAELFLVTEDLFGADDDALHVRAVRLALAAGLGDLLLEPVEVDGGLVDVAQGDPAGGDAVQLDDVADEVGGGLLPEGILAFAEELVHQRGHGVGERVGVHPGGVEGVPLPAPPESDLEVVLGAPGLVEDAADGMAEVALDLEHERGGLSFGGGGLPGQQLAGEGMHAGGSLAGADGSTDEGAGEEAFLAEDEPAGPLGLDGLGGMVEFRRRRGRGRSRRRREASGAASRGRGRGRKRRKRTRPARRRAARLRRCRRRRRERDSTSRRSGGTGRDRGSGRGRGRGCRQQRGSAPSANGRSRAGSRQARAAGTSWQRVCHGTRDLKSPATGQKRRGNRAAASLPAGIDEAGSDPRRTCPWQASPC